MSLRSGVSPGATAAALASALVAISGVLSPWPANWLDAAINEWLVWFTGLYVALTIALAVVERLRPRRVSVSDVVAPRTSSNVG